MNVLSLFDGISCGKVALDRAGVKYDNYFASEIDKYAIAIAKKNNPDIKHIGDVTQVKVSDLPKIDLLLAGSPCQGFSFAGKQLNFDDPRSKLFWEFVRLLKEIKPKYFLLENVRMKKEYENVITEAVGVSPIMINSALVSAQSRIRLYWTNIPYVVQPNDKKIYLKDIIEHSIVDRDKSFCIDANYYKGTNLNNYFEKHRRQIVFDSPKRLGNIANSSSQGCRVYADNGKSVCLNAEGGGWGAKTGLYAINKKKIVIDNSNLMPSCFVEARTEKGKQSRKIIRQQTGKDSTKRDKDSKYYKQRIDNKANCLVTVDTPERLVYNDYVIRKLTPIECERLQTLPDNYTKVTRKDTYFLYNGKVIESKMLCNARLKDVKKKLSHSSVEAYALNITKGLSEQEVLSFKKKLNGVKKNVSIVIEKLEKKEEELGGCVIDITKTGLDIKTLCTQIKYVLNLELMGIKKELMVKIGTEQYMRIMLEESLKDMKKYIILIVIKLITELKIFIYVKAKANIHFCIESLNVLEENLLNVELSNFQMDTITSLISKTQRYKCLGNGWTVDVIVHILKCIGKTKPSKGYQFNLFEV